MIVGALLALLGLIVPSLADAAACPGSGVAFSCPSGTTPAEVQSTITAASDGAVITFAAGSYTWGTSAFVLDNTKGWTLACASTPEIQGGSLSSPCTVTINSPGAVCCSNGDFSGTNTKLYRITGFTFQNAPSGSVNFYWYGTADAIATNVRMDHNTFASFGQNSIAIAYGGFSPNSEVQGLVDHNLFSGSSSYVMFKVLGRGAGGTYTTMPQTLTVRGTSNNAFFEDNRIDLSVMDGFSIPCFDAWNAGGIVFRFNYVRNCLIDAHSTAHGGGPVNFEFYGNALVRDSGSNSQGANVEEGYRMWSHQGAWESYVWNNTFDHLRTIHSQVISLDHYRSADMVEAFGSSIPAGRCDGNTSTRDGNTSPIGTYYGYPCWGQPGRAPANGSPVWGTLAPVYVFKNVDVSTSGKVDMVAVNPFSVNQPPSPLTHLVEGRDFYNAVSATAQTTSSSPFDGTTGVGHGTLANRPTTCTHTTSPDGDEGGGVAYWATDQGTWNQSGSNPQGINVSGADGVLYRCSATNTWTVHYTPYTYPHPLQGFVAAEVTGAGIKGSKGLGLF